MKRRLNSRAILLTLTAAACGRADRPDAGAPALPAATGRTGGAPTAEVVIVLDSGTVARSGLVSVPVAPTTRNPEAEVPALVIADPGAVTTVRAGIGGRLAAGPERPWPAVGEVLPAATEIAQVGDARPVTVPRSGTVTRLLAQPGELVQSGQALLELTDYRTALVRLALPGPGGSPASLEFRLLSGAARYRGRLEGPAPEADPLTGRTAVLYRVRSAVMPLRPGAVILALVPEGSGAPRGVMVPDEAVVQWQALAWVYVERSAGRYSRVRIPTDRPLPGGWQVQQGLAPGDRVVTRGAGQLLSEEFRARIVVGEEVGE